MSVTAIVPIKERSERVPGKNFRDLGGVPLYRHILTTLEQCALVTSILVDTDSRDLSESLSREHPNVSVRMRRPELGSSSASMDEVLREAVPCVDSEFVIQLHVTNPLLRSETIDRALELYISEERFGTLISADLILGRLWTEDSKPVNHDPCVMERTQDMRPVFKENSCFFVFRRDEMVKTGVRCISPVSFFSVSGIESVDIDTEEDFQLASVLYSAGYGALM
ncbi:acylneuraminate cytidylyltransferase family protein [Gordonia sp. VNK1]|uniref:acylneuraminate cytidylyltransferase family protein n=1 Tax=Gordonia oleivorans TaxID=3156618 RepID=UPI0032B6209C